MEVSNLIQGTPNWHEWRALGIGSSDAPVIMGVSPWKTPEELFLEKTGQVKITNKTTPAMARGTSLEPVARSFYELRTGIDFDPTIFEDKEHSFMRASLDGWNEEFKICLEIKAPNLNDHLQAVHGKVPEKYVYQVQHLIMVSGASRCDYFSFDGSHGVVVHVQPDPELIEKLRREEIKFWNCVVNKKWNGI